MKRKTSSAPAGTPAKKPKPSSSVPEYHSTPQLLSSSGIPIWPAPHDQMEAAKKFILECATSNAPTLLVPDKDADGLSSCAILHHSLVLLGLSPSLISVHLLSKGSNPFSPSERSAMAAYNPSYLVLLDHGSRSSPPLLPTPHKALIIDHHHVATPFDFPSGATFVTACDCPPVATSALLTFLLCRDLHPDAHSRCAWLCALGTHGDLGAVKWVPPFPDLTPTIKKVTRTAIDKAMGLVNAPRRTKAYHVRDAWDALLAASGPEDIVGNRALIRAREEVSAETERCAHARPVFSRDGRLAVLRIRSEAQVHPVIATRWAGHLKSRALEVVMVANEGYLEGMVNFSCRVARCARVRDGEDKVNIIQLLKEYADQAEDESLRERMGENFARGHKEASGGIVKKEEFEELMKAMGVGEKSEKMKKKEEEKARVKEGQKNKIVNYFQVKAG